MDVTPIDLAVDQCRINARPGQTVLEACLAAQHDIPYFCWHPALGSVGACRQCAIRVFNGPNDTTGQIAMACMTPATPGLRVSINDPAAAQFRERVIEFVLTNHPHDCPVCEVGGECHLQDMTALTQHNVRRYRFTKRTHLNQDLGPFLRHEMNRCIGCYRCVRFYRDYAGGQDFGVFGANRNIYFGRAEPGVLQSEFAGNLAEVCPTGVFVDKPFSQRFRRRWDMRATPAICPHCAVGCNITVQEREGEFRRALNRYNPELNTYFLCDRGRFGTGFLESNARLRETRLRLPDGSVTVLDQAATTKALAAFLSQDDIIGIGSPRASLEANVALRSVVGPSRFFAGVSDQDAAILATSVALIRDHAMPIASIRDIEQADAVLVLGDDPSEIAPRTALAIRQSAQRATAATMAGHQIQPWHDAAARIAGVRDHQPLVLATPLPTRLDDCAAAAHRLTPPAILALAQSVAEELGANPDQASPIAAILVNAAAPVIVVGGAVCGPDLLLAAANIVTSLRHRGIAARLSILLPEVNSLGLGLLGAAPLSAALALLAEGKAKRLIVLEGDLQRRVEPATLDAASTAISGLAVLDAVETATTNTADLAIGVASFAEADGIFVNQEGRAQRGFKAIFRTDQPRASWQILRDAGIAAGRLPDDHWPDHDAMIDAVAEAAPGLTACRAVWPASPRGTMQRPPTLPHRYSGRTAVNAKTDVREPAPIANPDSPLGTTMEGATPPPGAALMPLSWSPGWNSAQAVNRLPAPIDTGVLLFAGRTVAAPSFPMPTPARLDLLFIPVASVFGADELSALAPAIASRMNAPTIMLGAATAAAHGLAAGDAVIIAIGATRLNRSVTILPAMAEDVVGIVTGHPGDPALNLPGTGGMIRVDGGAP